jgi:hypothetical protein
MAATTHRAYSQSIATALSTDLNSLANNTNSAVSAAIDNSSLLDLFIDLELVVATQGGARTTGAYFSVYASVALDGTNYSDAHETTAQWLCDFPMDAATTARRVFRANIDISPLATFKLFLRNGSGQAMAASGNTLKYRTHAIQGV